MSVFPLKNIIYVTSKTSAMPLIQAQQLTDFTHSFKLLGFCTFKCQQLCIYASDITCTFLTRFSVYLCPTRNVNGTKVFFFKKVFLHAKSIVRVKVIDSGMSS